MPGRDIGEAGWWVLAVLADGAPRPVNRITEEISETVRPRTVDRTTIPHALRRLEQRGLIAPAGARETYVPGPYRPSTRLRRPVWRITAEGLHVVSQHVAPWRRLAELVEPYMADMEPAAQDLADTGELPVEP